MTNKTSNGVDAHELRTLLEKRHGEHAMHWRDQFALGCWLHHTGKSQAGRKIVREVLSTVRAHGNQQYLNAVTEEAAHNPVPLALSVWPHAEVVALFQPAKCEKLNEG